MTRLQRYLRTHTPAEGVALARYGQGRTIICDLAEGYDRRVYFGTEEMTELRLVEQLLRPGDTFVDCGANIGLFTVFAARAVGATGRVIAFEPHPPTFQRLRLNVGLSGIDDRVTMHQRALAAEEGHSVTLTGTAHHVMRITPTAEGASVVSTVTLDAAVNRPVTGIKIDVEGYELEVLRGASRLLADSQPWLLVEFNSALTDTSTLGDWPVHSELVKAGYQAHDPLSVIAGKWERLPPSWTSTEDYVNLLYVHRPK